MNARRVGVALSVAAGIAVVVVMAMRASSPPSRCGGGFVPVGARCCGAGQTVLGDRCSGVPTACGPDHDLTSAGCVPRRMIVALSGGQLRVGPSDWEAQGVVAPREIVVGPFRLDRYEIDSERLAVCLREGRCQGDIPNDDPGRAAEMTLSQARALCASEKGRLPTDDEWTFAAMGIAARRYPWGDTGAVCGRASYGLVSGPCARGASGPDTVGSRPLGRSPDGIDDLAGNLAEWTVSPTGEARLRGGSFASSLATDLRGWSAGRPAGPDARAGARCAYDR